MIKYSPARYALFLLMFALSGLWVQSCTPTDPCTDKRCLNKGRCLDGTCACRYGWAGDSCTILTDYCGILSDSCTVATTRECKTGACVCQDSWEGRYCSVTSADKYLGNYDVSEIIDNGASALNYTMRLARSTSDSTRFVFYGIHDIQGDTLLAVPIRNTFSIEEQLTASFLSISGSGRINDDHNTLWLDYIIFNNLTGDSLVCNSVLTKQ